MNDTDRDRLRQKQDHLLALAFAKIRDPERLHISTDAPGSPTVGELKTMLFPQWEHTIDDTINYLEREYGG